MSCTTIIILYISFTELKNLFPSVDAYTAIYIRVDQAAIISYTLPNVIDDYGLTNSVMVYCSTNPSKYICEILFHESKQNHWRMLNLCCYALSWTWLSFVIVEILTVHYIEFHSHCFHLISVLSFQIHTSDLMISQGQSTNKVE